MHYKKKNYRRGKAKDQNWAYLHKLFRTLSKEELSQKHLLFENYDNELNNAKSIFEEFLKSNISEEVIKNSAKLTIISLEKELLYRLSLEEDLLKSRREDRSRMGWWGRNFTFDSVAYESLNESVLAIRTDLARLADYNLSKPISSKPFSLDKSLSIKTKIDDGIVSNIPIALQDLHEKVFKEHLNKLSNIGVTIYVTNNTGSNEHGKYFIIKDFFTYKNGLRVRRDNFNLEVSGYREKYSLFRTDKITCGEYFNDRFSKIKKRETELNLRALASDKTEVQRQISGQYRTTKEFNNQIKILKDCPYCGGPLGGFSGLNSCHLEHIHPVSKGGLSTLQNCVFICADCNRNKSSSTLNKFIEKFDLNRDEIFSKLNVLGKDF